MPSSPPPCRPSLSVVAPAPVRAPSRGYYYHMYEGRKRKNPICGGTPGDEKIPGRGTLLLERRHHVPREPPQLLLELLGRQTLGPVDHEVLEPRVLRLDRLDPLDDVRWRAAEPRLLLDPL